MKPVDFLVIAIILLILGLVVSYIHRAKKKGVKCIGCPDGATCSGNCSCCSGHCSCAGDQQQK